MAEARQLLGVSSRTLRRYTSEGRLPDRRTPGGMRVFSANEVAALVRSRGGAEAEAGGKVVLYARVSSRRQALEGDLDRQMATLRASAITRVVAGEFSDIASGLSDRRRGLRQALQCCQSPELNELWVTHPERLARFGVGIIEQLLRPLATMVVVIGEEGALSESAESELVRDMLSVVTSFSGRLYGQRSTKARELRKCVSKALL